MSNRAKNQITKYPKSVYPVPELKHPIVEFRKIKNYLEI